MLAHPQGLRGTHYDSDGEMEALRCLEQDLTAEQLARGTWLWAADRFCLARRKHSTRTTAAVIITIIK